ncbi:MAG: hypothetical protein Q4F53_09155 [Nesterenkonia sp.]|nr:hypothetical protein [Nesterenkonia sp.]
MRGRAYRFRLHAAMMVSLLSIALGADQFTRSYRTADEDLDWPMLILAVGAVVLFVGAARDLCRLNRQPQESDEPDTA